MHTYIFMVRCQSPMLAIKPAHDDMKLSSLKCNVSSNQCATQNRDDVVLLVVQMQVHKDYAAWNNVSCPANREGR